MAPRIPPRLARRIDRLSRRAHAFHRFAHHPRGEIYRDEVIRVGKRTRLCKGCSVMAVGFMVGGTAGLATWPPLGWGALALLLALLAGLLSLRVRLPKVVGRFLPGAGLGLALWAGWPSVLGSLLFLVALGLLYRRRGVERSRCEACPERLASPCSGFALIVRRERAFARQANRWVAGLPRSMA